MSNSKSIKSKLKLNKFIQVGVTEFSDVANKSGVELKDEETEHSNYDLYEVTPVTLRLENVLNISNLDAKSSSSNVSLVSSVRNSGTKLNNLKTKFRSISEKLRKSFRRNANASVNVFNKSGSDLLEKELVLSLSVIEARDISTYTQTTPMGESKNLIYVTEEKKGTMAVFDKQMDRWSVLDEEFVDEESKAEHVREEEEEEETAEARKKRLMNIHGYLIPTRLRKVHSDDSALFVRTKDFFAKPETVYNNEYEEDEIQPALIRISSESVYGLARDTTFKTKVFKNKETHASPSVKQRVKGVSKLFKEFGSEDGKPENDKENESNSEMEDENLLKGEEEINEEKEPDDEKNLLYLDTTEAEKETEAENDLAEEDLIFEKTEKLFAEKKYDVEQLDPVVAEDEKIDHVTTDVEKPVPIQTESVITVKEDEISDPVIIEVEKADLVVKEDIVYEPLKTAVENPDSVVSEDTVYDPVKTKVNKSDPVVPKVEKPHRVVKKDKIPDPVKTEDIKTHPIETVVKKPHPVKTEIKKPDPVKTEIKKPDPVKIEDHKTEPVKSEVKKPDPIKTETKKSDPVKTEGKKPEPVKHEHKQKESMQNEPKTSQKPEKIPVQKHEPVRPPSPKKPPKEYVSVEVKKEESKTPDDEFPPLRKAELNQNMVLMTDLGNDEPITLLGPITGVYKKSK